MSLRIAMWSGPRNISTALMRSFEARGDCAVTDEPLYAHYLDQTGIEHPGYAEVIGSQSRDWESVVEVLSGPIPGNKSLWYQKHMAHHLLPNLSRAWMAKLRHVLLIRRPEEVLASYLRTRGTATLEDLGFEQQCAILDFVTRELDQPPLVLESRDVLERPGDTLSLLCEALGIDYTERMLSWGPGRRSTDGVWAKYWYASVERSTGFQPYTHKPVAIPAEFMGVLEGARPLYDRLWSEKLILE
jgi:hypothetical protein